jgi:hypothetical protein
MNLYWLWHAGLRFAGCKSKSASDDRIVEAGAFIKKRGPKPAPLTVSEED